MFIRLYHLLYRFHQWWYVWWWDEDPDVETPEMSAHVSLVMVRWLLPIVAIVLYLYNTYDFFWSISRIVGTGLLLLGLGIGYRRYRRHHVIMRAARLPRFRRAGRYGLAVLLVVNILSLIAIIMLVRQWEE